MNIADIYDHAIQRGIQLRLEDGRLLYTAGSGGLDRETRELLKLHKAELIAYMNYLAEVRSKAGLTLPKITRIQRDRPACLSYGQQQLMFLDRLGDGQINYNIPAVYRVHGALDIAALRAALCSVIERHEALRTQFLDEGGEQYQRVSEQFSIPLTVVDLADAVERDAEIERLIKEDVLRLFDISKDVLVRMNVLVLSNAEHILMFNTHHIVSDGWSIGIFMGELATLYNAYVSDQPNPLAPLEIQYLD